MDTYKTIYEYLLTCGCTPKLSGFKYLIDAINICLDNEFINSFEKDVYFKISEKYKKNLSAVKKAIKNAIDTAALNYDLNDETCVFNMASSIKSGSIPSAEFIAYSAQKIKYSS